MLTGGPSYWFHAIGGLPRPRPALPGPADVDVAIVGGGFTGLWTAYYLKQADPSLRDLRARAGGVRLGRVRAATAAGCAAPSRASAIARTQAAIDDAVDEIGRVCAAEGVECDFHKGGALHVVTAPRAAAAAASARQGWLEPAQLDERIRVAGALGGVFEPNYARVQPAALARGLADVVERLGVGVYEATRVESIAPGVARTAQGDVRASWVVRATEGYTPHLGGAPPRALIPLRSTMIVTEPLPDDVWAQIGWQGAELVHDAAHSYVYIQQTADGRIAIGGPRPAVLLPVRATTATARSRTPRLDRLAERLHELWPATREVADRARVVGRVRGAARLEADRRGRPRHRAGVGRRLRRRRRLRRQPVGPHAGRPRPRRAVRPRHAAVREPAAAARLGAGAAAVHRRATSSTRCSGPPTGTSAARASPRGSAISQPGSPAGGIARRRASEPRDRAVGSRGRSEEATVPRLSFALVVAALAAVDRPLCRRQRRGARRAPRRPDGAHLSDLRQRRRHARARRPAAQRVGHGAAR